MIFFGRNVVYEALNSELYSPSKVFVQSGAEDSDKISEIIRIAKANKIHVQNVSHKELKKITGGNEHQGAAVEVNDFHVKSKLNLNEDDVSKTYLFIYEATYEHNIGAIVRSAEVAGIDGVIIPTNAKITGTVGRTSAGSIFHIPIYKASIFNAIKEFQRNFYRVIGIERDGEKLFESNLTGNILLIIGGEDKELSGTLRSKCDTIVEIPQKGKVNSLNMSVAASIALFERIRQTSK